MLMLLAALWITGLLAYQLPGPGWLRYLLVALWVVFAVTGAVDQHGRVLPIGAVNEKIEGFFDVCAPRGLTGDQGVIIPAANLPHLMLRPDVVAAVADGRFHVHAVETVDEALSLLAGLEAGAPDDDGYYPAGTANARVMERLTHLSLKRLAYMQASIQAKRPMDSTVHGVSSTPRRSRFEPVLEKKELYRRNTATLKFPLRSQGKNSNIRTEFVRDSLGNL